MVRRLPGAALAAQPVRMPQGMCRALTRPAGQALLRAILHLPSSVSSSTCSSPTKTCSSPAARTQSGALPVSYLPVLLMQTPDNFGEWRMPSGVLTVHCVRGYLLERLNTGL